MSVPPVSPAPAPSKNKAMAILAYIGILVVVSYLVANKDPFVKFHIKQGLLLLIIEVAVWLLSSFLWGFWMIWQLIDLVVLVLAIIGIVNAVQGKEKELPVIGSWARNFNF